MKMILQIGIAAVALILAVLVASILNSVVIGAIFALTFSIVASFAVR